MASNASEAHSQTNDQLKIPTPRPIAERGSIRARPSTSRKVRETIAAHTPPTTASFNSALPSSEAPRRPNSRLMPASGLKRVEAGAMGFVARIPAPQQQRGQKNHADQCAEYRQQNGESAQGSLAHRAQHGVRIAQSLRIDR